MVGSMPKYLHRAVNEINADTFGLQCGLSAQGPYYRRVRLGALADLCSWTDERSWLGMIGSHFRSFAKLVCQFDIRNL